MVYAEQLLCFLASGILVCDRQRVPVCPASRNNLVYRVSNGLPWQIMLRTHGHNLLLKKLSVSYVTPPGEDSLKFVPGFLWTLTHVPFPFALYLSNKSPNLRVVLGTFNIFMEIVTKYLLKKTEDLNKWKVISWFRVEGKA